jgi:hypothetical protein
VSRMGLGHIAVCRAQQGGYRRPQRRFFITSLPLGSARLMEALLVVALRATASIPRSFGARKGNTTCAQCYRL